MHKDWHVALVAPGTAFDPVAHRRADLPVIAVRLIEGEVEQRARLALVCVWPSDDPILPPGGPRWVHLSRELADGSLLHMASGYVLPAPTRGEDDTVTLEFNCSPLDFETAKSAALQALKVLPFFDPVLVPRESRDDPVEILDGYSRLPHCHRATHTISAPDVCGHGAPLLVCPAPLMPGPTTEVTGVPLAGVRIDLTAEWVQRFDGETDMSSEIAEAFAAGQVNTLTPEDLERGWPKPGSDVNGDSGWKIVESVLERVSPGVGQDPTAGPFGGPSSTYNYVEDENLENPLAKDVTFERTWFDATLRVSFSIRQKRIERVVAIVTNQGQGFGQGEWATLTLTCEDIQRDDVTPDWIPLGVYYVGDRVRVGAQVWDALVDHEASDLFSRDVFYTAPNGTILQRWQISAEDGSPLGNPGASGYFTRPRGEQTLRAALLKARALIAASQRCVEVRFRHELTDDLLGITTAHRIRVLAPADMLQGGEVEAKCVGYEIVSDQADEYLEVTIRAAVGSGAAAVGGVAGVTQDGEPWDRIGYDAYADQAAAPYPALVGVAEVVNDVPDQVAHLDATDFDPAAGRADPAVHDPKTQLREVPTELRLAFTAIAGRADMENEIVLPIATGYPGPRQYEVE